MPGRSIRQPPLGSCNKARYVVVWRPRVLWVRSLAGTSSLFCSFYALTRLPVAADRTKAVGSRQRILEGHVVVNGHDLTILVGHWTSVHCTPL